METEIEQEQQTDLGCDLCATPMLMSKDEGRADFTCPSCGRWRAVFSDGSSQYDSAMLWPSQMDENGDMFRNEYLPWWEKDTEWDIQARYTGGLDTLEEMQEHRREYEGAIAEWHANHPLPKKPWWRFW